MTTEASTAQGPAEGADRHSAIPHLVIIVPGIRDRGGDWNVVCRELQMAGLSATIAGWAEFFSLPRFLVPAPWFRRIAMRSLLRRISRAIQAYTYEGQLPRVSFIGHSFGSYILSYVLRKEPSIQTYRLILCGSVLGRDFDFTNFMQRFEGPVINDVGKKDDWPFWASCVTFGYGTVGTYGYIGEPVVDRFHKCVGHSDFSEPGFCAQWWIPYLQATGRDGIALPPPGDNVPRREGAIVKTVRGLLQNLKWIIAAGIGWLAIAMPLSKFCGTELANLNSMTKIEWTGNSERLVELGSALRLADNRMQAEAHLCGRIPRWWPFATRWPSSRTVPMYDQGDIMKLKACRTRTVEYALPQRLATAESGAEAMDILVGEFGRCVRSARDKDGKLLEVSLSSRGGSVLPIGVERLVLEERGQDSRLPHPNVWFLCDCHEEDIVEFRRMRGAL
jgi:hypothetical protein